MNRYKVRVYARDGGHVESFHVAQTAEHARWAAADRFEDVFKEDAYRTAITGVSEIPARRRAA